MPRGRPGAASVRVRATAAAVAVVAVALLVGGLAVVNLLRAALLEDLTDTAVLRAQEIAGAVEDGRQPPVVVADVEDQLVQVVDGDGRVVAGSPNAGSGAPVTDLEPGGSSRVVGLFDAGDGVVVAVGAETPDGRVTVLVGRGTDDVAESVAVVTRLLAVGAPALLALVAVVTWAVVGRALHPVEAIRREVEGISADQLHRRVPGPAVDDEIGRLARTMNSMLDRLEGSQRRQQQFVADASHELRSPVASMRQNAEVARAHPATTSVPELADVVLADAGRLQEIVDDLLVLVRAEAGAEAGGEGRAGARRPVDVDDLALDEARRLRETTALRVDVSRVSAGRVLGDPAALRRVLRNLGDNAARHARSMVGLTVHEEGETVLVAVSDDGPGIPEADRERVLERFVRLDEGRSRDAGGTGLGLAIVAAVVRAHAGTVSIGSDGSGGARVEVRLPRAD